MPSLLSAISRRLFFFTIRRRKTDNLLVQDDSELLSDGGFRNAERNPRRAALSTSALSSVVDLLLPIELWRLIFEFVDDQCASARILLLHPALYPEAEDILYRSITLASDRSVTSLSESITSYPRRGLLVHALHVHTPLIESNTALCLASLLRFLNELRELTLDAERLWRPQPAWDFGNCYDVLAVRFPHLRRLATAGPPLPEIAANLLRNHRSTLQELDVRNAQIPSSANFVACNYRMVFPALKVLECAPSFVLIQKQIPEQLTHLHLVRASVVDLMHISVQLGPRLRLVSLRLSGGAVNGMQWSVRDVVERFPSLKLIQGNTACINEHPIHWEQTCSDSEITVTKASPPHLTVLWTTEQQWTERASIIGPAAWNQFIGTIASRVVVEWGSYIKRIVYRWGGSGPFTAVYLSDDRQDVLHTIEKDIREDYWRTIPD